MNQTKRKLQVTNVRRVCAVKWAAVCEPCSSTSLWVQHLHVSEGLAEQSACVSLMLFDSPGWQLMSRIKGEREEGERKRGTKRWRDREGGKSSRTYCGSAVLLCCGSAKDRLRILAVTQQPHNSSLALIDFILPVLRSNRVLCELAEFRDLQASAAQLKPWIWFQTYSPGILGLMHQTPHMINVSPQPLTNQSDYKWN